MSPLVQHSPPPLHHPGEVTRRPKGILKNPSFSGPSGGSPIPPPVNEPITYIPSAPLHPVDSKEITLANTLQNAGHRRSSSAARRASASRRQSHGGTGTGSGSMSIPEGLNEEEHEKMRLKWDEANLYLAEQGKSSTMKINEPKTPYEFARDLPPEDEDEEDDIGIDPKYVNVDEVEMQKAHKKKGPRESDIPGLELGEPEEDFSFRGGDENDRIIGGGSVSREGSASSREKHVSVSGESGHVGDDEERVGMPTQEEMEKHRQFEERRKRHYEMRDVKDLLGHPESADEMDEDDEFSSPFQPMQSLPNRGINGMAR